MSDEDNSFYAKKPKGRHRGKGAHTVKLKRERKSYHGSSRQRRRKSSFDDDESSAEDSESDSDVGFKSTRRKVAHIRKSNGRTTNVSGRNGEVRTSTRSVRKVSYVESEESEEVDEGKKKKSQKVQSTSVTLLSCTAVDFNMRCVSYFTYLIFKLEVCVIWRLIYVSLSKVRHIFVQRICHVMIYIVCVMNHRGL